MTSDRRTFLATVSGLAIGTTAGCLGDGSNAGQADSTPLADDPTQSVGEPGELTPKDSITEDFSRNHLHGIEVDHRNDRLYLASHYGLFVLEDDSNLFFVGDSLADHMGFTMHPEETTLLYRSGHPQDGGNLGVQRSTDGGMTWETIFTGIDDETVDFHSMAISDADPDRLVGAYAGGLYVTVGAGENWRLAGGDGLPGRGPCWGVPCLAADTVDGETLLAGTDEGLLESQDFGETWEPRTAEPVMAVTVHPDDASTLYGFVDDALAWSDDRGDSWSVLHPEAEFARRESVFRIAIDRETPTTLYAATTIDRVLKSTDSGEQWDVILD